MLTVGKTLPSSSLALSSSPICFSLSSQNQKGKMSDVNFEKQLLLKSHKDVWIVSLAQLNYLWLGQSDILISGSFWFSAALIISNSNVFNHFLEIFSTIKLVPQVLCGNSVHLSPSYKYLCFGYFSRSVMHFLSAKYFTWISIKRIGKVILKAIWEIKHYFPGKQGRWQINWHISHGSATELYLLHLKIIKTQKPIYSNLLIPYETIF